VEDRGLEPLAETAGKTGASPEGDAESDAQDRHLTPDDPDLRTIVDAWPTLPLSVRDAITRMVQQAMTATH